MDKPHIYFAAVVWPQDSDQPPYVSTALGPYAVDAYETHQRAEEWLKDVYKTDDVRRTEPHTHVDIDWGRTMVMNSAHLDYRAAQERARKTVQIQMFSDTGEAVTALDEVIAALDVLSSVMGGLDTLPPGEVV